MNPARFLARHQGPESPEAFSVTTAGKVVWASPTMLQATTRSFVQWSLTSGGQVARNGFIDPVTSLVTELVYHNHTLFQGTSRPDWYYWNTTTSDGTPGTPGWVFFNLLGPISLSATTYAAGAVAGTVIATISVPMSANAAGDTFPGVWGGTLTLGGPDGGPNGSFVINGTTLSVAPGHTLSNTQYNITISAQVPVGSFNVGNQISAQAFQLTQVAQGESAEAFSFTTVGPSINASRTMLVASTGPFNTWALTTGAQITLDTGSGPVLQTVTSNVIALVYHDHTLFQENGTPDWWYWNTSTSDPTPGTPGWVYFNLLGPIALNTLNYPGGATAGTTVATVSVPMSSNVAADTFPGPWGGTLTLGGADGPPNGPFVISGQNINVAAGHTLSGTGQTYNITITAQVPVGTFNVGKQLGPTAFALTGEFLTIATIPTQTVGASFTVSGTISNAIGGVAPTLQYQDNTGAFVALPGGASVSATSFSFLHPAIGAASGAFTVSVRDANHTTVVITSNSFVVQAASAESPAGTDIFFPSAATINASPTPGSPGSGVVIFITAGQQLSVNGVVGGAAVTEIYYDFNHTAWQLGSGSWYGPITTSSTGTGPDIDPHRIFAINTIPTINIGSTFTVSGTINGYPTTAPTMQYRDDSGTWLALPAGAIVTASTPTTQGTFSFTHPSFGIAANHTTSVRDANATLFAATSNTYSVAVVSANKVIWGTNASWRTAPTVASQNALISGIGQTIRTMEDYYVSGWSGPFDGFSAGDIVSDIPASAGGIPMMAFNSNGATYQSIASGAVDANLNNMFQQFKNAGYTQMIARIFWETNGQQTDPFYSAAWQHVANLCFNFPGMKIYTVWNPMANNNALPNYPSGGDAFVDWIGIDESANWASQGLYSNVLDITQADYWIGGAASLAAAKNKPLAMCEMGVANSGANTGNGGNNENHQTPLNGAINATQTSINVVSAAGFPGTPFPIQIDSEWLNVTGVAGNTLTIGPYSGVAGGGRGFNGTTAAAHNNGATVIYGGYCAWMCNILTVLHQTGAKLILAGFYNGSNNGDNVNEDWCTDPPNAWPADTQAVINFMNLCPVWSGNLSTTGH